MIDETIEIKPCPLCGKAHKYILSIQRSTYLFGAASKGDIRKIKRLFTCPKSNETFESVLEIKEDERGIIAKLDIMGVVEEKKNGGQK